MATLTRRFTLRRKLLLAAVALLLALVGWLHATGAAGTRGLASEDMDWNADGTVTGAEILQAFTSVTVRQSREGARECSAYAWRGNGQPIRVDCRTSFREEGE